MKTRTWLLAVGLAGAWAARAEIVSVADTVAVPGAGPAAPLPAKTASMEGKTAAEAGNDVLYFLNGDRLRGTLLDATPADFGLKWRNAEVDGPMAISLRQLDRVKLGRRAESDSKTPVSLVRLSNDDSLSGEIVSLQGDALVLKTTYAGNVTLKRSMLSQICPGKEVAGVIYEGPEDMTGWITGDGGTAGWTVKEGQLIGVGSSSVGRDLPDLPDSAEIQFTVASDGPYLQLNVAFCSDNLRGISGNTYYFQFSGSSGYLYRYSNNSGSRNLGQGFQLEGRRGMPMRKADMRILVNRQKKTIALVINGSLVRQWTDPEGFPGSGKGLLFAPSGNRCRIGAIRVAAWDGRIVQAGDVADSGSPADSVVLANGDKISGKLIAIQGKAAKLETSYAPLEIPLERISEIALGREGRERARRNKNDIQCKFAGGGTLTLDFVSLEKGQLAGKSENFGEIKLSLSAFEGIKFNPWTRPVESKDPADPGSMPDVDE